MIYAQLWINEDSIVASEVSKLPPSGGGIGNKHEYSIVVCITTEETNPIVVFESLSISSGVITSSLGSVEEISVEESQLLKWRQTCKVSNFQAKAALLESDLLEPAEAIVNILGGKVKLSWDLEPTWSRTSKEIISIGEALGLSDTDIDNLFKLAEVQ